MTADGFFKSGDIGVMDERGYIKIVDRKKDMILVSGFNVYPNEVEAVVAALPGRARSARRSACRTSKSGEAVKLFVVQKDPALDRGGPCMAYCKTQPDRLQEAERTSSSAATCRRPMSARSCGGSSATK